MSSATPTTVLTHPQARGDPPTLLRPHVPAPLLPVALAATAGIAFDRFWLTAPSHTPLPWLVAAGGLTAICAGVALAGWRRRPPSPPPTSDGPGAPANQARSQITYPLLDTTRPLLLILAALLGGAWHHVRHLPFADDVGQFASDSGSLVRLRGYLIEDVVVSDLSVAGPLRSISRDARSSATAQALEVLGADGWRPANGRVRIALADQFPAVIVGDECEAMGMLYRPLQPSNPGEADIRGVLEDRDIRAVLQVKSADGIACRQRGPWWSLDATLARVRHWSSGYLSAYLAPQYAGVASALLLGNQKAMEAEQLEAYRRTGVINVLALSGQQLVILCGGLWLLRRVVGVGRRFLVVLIMVFVILYALLTGCQPSVVRAAVIVTTFCGAILLGRRLHAVNALALAWLIVAILNPADLFSTGCQISFLAVLILYEVISPWHLTATRPRDNLRATLLLESARPWWLRVLAYPFSAEQHRVDAFALWQRVLLSMWSWLAWTFLAGLVIWLMVTPLVMDRYHLLSPVAIVLNPPLIILTSVALFSTFLLLLLPGLAVWTWPLAWLIDASLAASAWLVRAGEQVPASYWYCADLPDWWVWGFYLLVLGYLLAPVLRTWWRGLLGLAALWLSLLAILPAPHRHPAEFRCTFLAVGHGSCAVLETPDGRTLLYDAGSVAGPDVTVRQIAPFLWSRGITRIDEIFLSHADLDHFNGLPALLQRFDVSQVSLTPRFLKKRETGVSFLEAQLTARGTPVRTLHAGQSLTAGSLRIDVLHPPADGPEGAENARSLVLLVTHGRHSILLTGDLEEPGMGMVLQQPAPPIDVLLAPHHGSLASNTTAFAQWARPRLVVSSEGKERGRRVDPYTPLGGTLWRTQVEGAVTVQVTSTGMTATTFRTQNRWSSE